jgi:hypothetical protein
MTDAIKFADNEGEMLLVEPSTANSGDVYFRVNSGSLVRLEPEQQVALVAFLQIRLGSVVRWPDYVTHYNA